MKIENALDTAHIFSDLRNEERQKWARLCHFSGYDQGQDIFSQDDKPSKVYFILSGQIRLKTYSESGQEIFFDIVGPGEMFGEKAALDNQPHGSSAVALTGIELSVMPQRYFLSAFETVPGFGQKVAQNLCSQIRRGHARIMDLGTIAANNRVHAEILRLARLVEPDENGDCIIFPSPQHADISHQVCAARETVSRAFGEMAKLGITQKVKGGLAITDIDRLEDMVACARSGERRSGHDRRYGSTSPLNKERRGQERRT